MLLSKEVEVNCRPSNKNHLESKGYNWEYNNIILVKVEDLSEGSASLVKIQCDYCNRTIVEKTYKRYLRDNKYSLVHTDCCDNVECMKIKRSEILLLKYGVDNSNKAYSIIDKNISKFDNLFNEKQVKPLKFTYKTEKELLPFMCLKHSKIVHKSLSRLKVIDFICEDCINEFKNKIYKKDFETVKQEFEDNDLILCNDAEYVNSHTKVKCYCKYHPDENQWIDIQQANRKYHGCNKCKEKMNTQENNPNWKGGITPIHEQIRRSDEYVEWRNSIFKRDNYECQCCGDNIGGNLHAHHIQNFSECEDLRFDVDNGITLCDLCHNVNKYGSFHNVYNTRNNNANQLYEYIKNYKNGEYNELRKLNDKVVEG